MKIIQLPGKLFDMRYKKRTEEIVKKVVRIAHQENKLSGFCIGNTAKIDSDGLYFTPIRHTFKMIVAGVIVYSEQQAIEVAKVIDGRVNYILVDAEKKIPDKMSRSGEPANVERAVREVLKKSTLWIYKGNDLAVEAIDGLLSYLTKDSLTGIGGKKIAILGAGNLGCKLALKLVERGAHIFITRRDSKKVRAIAKVFNYIKPAYTTAQIVAATDNEKAAQRADILIGLTSGIPVVTSKIIKNLASGALVVDGGKGTLYSTAIKTAAKLNIKIYRLDISAAFEGMINNLFVTERIVKKRMGRRLFNDAPIVSGGLLGRKDEIVVDNVYDPKIIYGVADGKGDFIRRPSKRQLMSIKKIQRTIDTKARTQL